MEWMGWDIHLTALSLPDICAKHFGGSNIFGAGNIFLG